MIPRFRRAGDQITSACRRSRIVTSLRSRLPSRGEVLSVFGVVVFVVHSWSVRGFLYHLPSFLLKKSVGEIAAIFSYHMVFALLESGLVLAAILALAFLLPSALLQQGFVYKGFLIVTAAAVAAILLQDSPAYETFTLAASNDPGLIGKISATVIICIVLGVLAHRRASLQRALVFLVDQISIMLFVYLPLDIIGLLMVAARLM